MGSLGDSQNRKEKMKRYLREEIEQALILITIVQVILLITINDFELIALPFILIHVAIIYTNINILQKYGKGLWLEEKI